MIHLTVQIDVKAERLSDFLRLVTAHQRLSRLEPGCFQFDVCRQGRCEFLLYEVWKTQHDLKRHRTTEHYARWREAMPSIEFLPRVRTEYETLQTVWLTGCFDGADLHAGHLHILTEAGNLGFLTVAINTDASVRRRKGEGRPVVGDAMRAARLRALPHVGSVVLFDTEEELAEMLRAARPDVRVAGSDWRDCTITGASHCGRVHFMERIPGVSTTAILAAQHTACPGLHPAASP